MNKVLGGALGRCIFSWSLIILASRTSLDRDKRIDREKNRHSCMRFRWKRGRIIIRCSVTGYWGQETEKKNNDDVHRNYFPLIFKCPLRFSRITVFINFSRIQREIKLLRIHLLRCFVNGHLSFCTVFLDTCSV